MAKLPSGDFLTTLMTGLEIEGIRNRSEAWKSNQSGPWKTDPEEMRKKTVVRRASKTWPRSTGDNRLAEAVNISNENEGFEEIKNAPEVSGVTGSQKEYFDALIKDDDAIGMKVLSLTLSTADFMSLYHSFERGTKGKYQAMVDSLTRQGHDLIHDIRLNLINACEADDIDGAREILMELSEDELTVVTKELSSEVLLFINPVTKGN